MILLAIGAGALAYAAARLGGLTNRTAWFLACGAFALCLAVAYG